MNQNGVAKWDTKTPGQLISGLAFPTVVAMVVTSVYQLADLFFGAKLGEDSVAGMGMVFSVYALLQAVGYTVALGGSTWVSCLLGKERPEQTRRVSCATLWLGMILGTVLGAMGCFFTRPLLSALGADGQTLALGAAYARPLLLSAPFLFGGFCLSCLLRTLGKSAGVMAGILAGSLVKVAATPLFLFVLQWGVAGAGIATLFGQATAFFILLPMYGKQTETFAFSPKQLPRCIRDYWQIFRYGISSLFRQGTVALSTAWLNRRAMGSGEGAVAALAIAGRVAGLIYSACLGWGQGYQPVAGYHHGKQQLGKIKQAFAFTLITGTAGMTVLAVFLWLFAPELMQWFGGEGSRVVAWGSFSLRAQALFLPLIPLGVLTNMTYQSMERPWMATLLACCRQGFCLMPLIWLLPKGWGIYGLLAAQGVADGLTFVLSLPAIIWLFKKKRNQ